MNILAMAAIIILTTGCSFTITRTTINIEQSKEVSVESLQEQKSDTTSDTMASAKIGLK